MDPKQRILAKFTEMNRYLHELDEFLPATSREYRSQTLPKRASEKTIELAIECVYDVMAMVIGLEKIQMPEEEESFARILAKHNIIDKDLAMRVQAMRGFRNLLVHRYAKIDDAKAYKFFNEEMGDFKEFETKIIVFLKTKK